MDTTTDNPVDRFLDEISGGTGITTDGWAADAHLDATVPLWRFEREGAPAVAEQLSSWDGLPDASEGARAAWDQPASWYGLPTTIESVGRLPIPGGEAVELDLAWVEDGVP